MRLWICSSIAVSARQRMQRRLYSSLRTGVFQTGDFCILRDGRGQRTLIGPLEANGKRDTHRGIVSHSDIIEKPIRSLVRSHTGTYYTVHSPTLTEFTMMYRRKVTPIYPQDASAILNLLDLFPGAKILDAGTGNGALSMHLAMAGAIVTTCDVDIENSLHAKKVVGHFQRGLLSDRISFISSSLSEYLGSKNDSKEYDGVVLDMPNPQNEFSNIMPHLCNDRCIIAYVPNLSQVMACVEVASGIDGLHFEQCIDVSWKEWDVRKTIVRARDNNVQDAVGTDLEKSSALSNEAWVCRPKNYQGNSFTAFLAVFRKGININIA